MLQVASLHIYPVKSCAGVSVPSWPISRYGFAHDREFLVVDEYGKFLTQRTHPKLALIQPVAERDVLRLQAPDLAETTVPWFGSAADRGPKFSRPVSIWRDQVEADDLGEEIAEWFTSLLGLNARLVRIGSRYRRAIDAGKVPIVHRENLGVREVSFADAYPFLITSEASLADLNQRLPQSVPMNRFRPNIVVGGVMDPYAEDHWQTVEIGPLLFRHRGPCVRCVVTTTDQVTLERGNEPLKTLATYRRDGEGGVIFGMNFFCESSTGTIRVGDRVRRIQLSPNDVNG
jgi:uncharacterized protein YcbX